jgi:signal transduction histidine kinase
MAVNEPKPSVLLVDDIQANLVALAASLDGVDCEIVLATSGNEALRKLLKHPCAVMLLDVQMPAMDGFEVARLARADAATRDVPIIFVTAMNETPEHASRGYGSGAVDILFKPVDPAILRSKVQIFLELYGARQQLEATVRARTAELREALQVREDFLATAGHELRTPLTSMQLQVQSLERMARKDPALGPLADRLAKVSRSGLRMEKLINQLLDVSRINAGRLLLDPEPVDLAELMSEVLARYGDATDKTSSAIDVLGADAKVLGHWDRLRVDQVITNLVENALKYGKSNPITVELRVEGNDAVLRVVDRGVGIDEAHQKKIFRRFERVGETREVGGFGLGLWISRQIVEASGGSIELESTPGRGSAFTVRLPMTKLMEGAS